VLGVDLEMRACAVLGRVGGEGAEALLAVTLAGPRVQSAVCAALALGEGGFFGRMPDLVRRLDVAAREEGGERSDEVEQLIDAIARMAERSERAGDGVHVQLVEVLASRLGGSPEAVRVAIARVLARIGREADADVIEYLSKDASPLVRRAAVQALVRFEPERIRHVMRLALGDEASGVRIAAAAVLARSGSRDAIEDLARLSGDGDARVAAAALRAAGPVLERMGGASPADRAWLVRALGGDALVALAALESLERIGGPDVVQAAASTLDRAEPEVLRTAIGVLSRHAANDDLAPIAPLVAHPDWSVRAEAVKTLSARRFRRALPAMLRRLDVEDDAFVREALLAAARRLEE
jgi:HEAT repeat protein